MPPIQQGPPQSMTLLDARLQTTSEEAHFAHCPLHSATQSHRDHRVRLMPKHLL